MAGFVSGAAATMIVIHVLMLGSIGSVFVIISTRKLYRTKP